MGCICSKGTRANEDCVHPNSRNKERSKLSRRLTFSSKRHEDAVEVDANGNDATASLISNQSVSDNVGYASVSSDEEGNKKKSSRFNTQNLTRIVSMANGDKGAQVAAGWPSWLTAVAGEAINGWLPRKADSFEKLDKIGQGTYSTVYKARDLETHKIVALKKVRFANMDPESVRFMAREIIILRRLDHPNVMKLEGIITSRMSGSLYLVFDYMDHDLVGLLTKPEVKFTEAQIKCYMQQLLRGLHHCHGRGVLHRDIKGSNLLLDHNGNLKIGDFGLATFFSTPQRQPLTSRVVTLWYRPPELLLGATEYGVAVDLWSTGCILAELFNGKPIMAGRTEVEQLHKIFKLCGSPSDGYWKKSKLPHATIFKPQNPYKRCVSETFKDLPKSALDLLDILLAVEPDARGTASSALASEYFKTKPLPCDPSSLPKYPPSKELDSKLREDAKRRKAAGGNEHGKDASRKSSKESKAVPAPDANAELPASILKRQQHSHAISISEKYNSEEDSGSGFPIEAPKRTARNGCSQPGQLMHPSNLASSNNRSTDENYRPTGQRSFVQRGAAHLSRFSNSVAIRDSSQFDSSTSMNPHWPEEPFNNGYNNPDDSSHHLLGHSHNGEQPPADITKSFYPKKGRIHYSGPLVPPGGNIEEMLKEHEKQIRQAVRKARIGKSKASKNEAGQTETLLQCGT